MPKWITVQVEDETHRKLHTAAVANSQKLKDYVAAVLDAHAKKLDVKVT